MQPGISESMKIALLLSSVSHLLEYGPITSSVNTLQKETATCEYVSMLFIEESRRLNMNRTLKMKQSPDVEGSTIAYANRRNGSDNISKRIRRTEWSNMRCFNCYRIGQKSTQCRFKPRTDTSAENNRQLHTKNHHSATDTNVRRDGSISTLKNRSKAESTVSNTIDSGASEHAVNGQSLFQTLKPIEPVTLKLADGSMAMAEGKRSVLVQVHTLN